MNPIVITPETMPEGKIEAVLFAGIVNNRAVNLSPLLNEGGNLYAYQVVETGDLVSPKEIKPIPTAKAKQQQPTV
jgi:hypothetical protein